ncbi:MAG: hypothetical protein ACLT8E_03585 [Akkermansia sp.]
MHKPRPVCGGGKRPAEGRNAETRGILLASYLVVYYLGTVLGQPSGWFPSDMSLVVTEVCFCPQWA